MRCTFIAIFVGFMFTAGGCYYQITDPRTGQTFFTNRWVAADGYTGPLKFKDHSGRAVSLQSTRVLRISKDEYLEATLPPEAPSEAPPEAPPETSPPAQDAAAPNDDGN